MNNKFITTHGTETLDLTNLAAGELITKVMLADEVDTQQAIRAAQLVSGPETQNN